MVSSLAGTNSSPLWRLRMRCPRFSRTTPSPARAQQGAMPLIGFLDTHSPEPTADRLRGFHRGLRESGYVEGENVAIVYRWAEGQTDRLLELAAELVRRQVAVIAVTGGTPAAL